VKTWLSGSSGIGSSDDALIARLITDVSGAIAAYLGRAALTPRPFAERFDGNGKTRVWLRHYPVLQVSSLVIDNVAVAAAAAPAAGASHRHGYLLEPWDGLPPGRPQPLDVFGTAFHDGRQNVSVNYSAGYAVIGESATIPAAPGPYTVTAAAPFGPWASDYGVTYANGSPLAAVAGSPARQSIMSREASTASPPPTPAPRCSSPTASSRPRSIMRASNGSPSATATAPASGKARRPCKASRPRPIA
jgi:hypothetical protein